MSETAKRLAKTATPAKRGPGQPTKLNAQLAKKICELLVTGLPLQSIAERCGLAYQTLDNYRTQPSEFLAAIKEAEGVAEARWVSTLETRENRWQAHAWLLERRYRNRYGRVDKVEHSGTVKWPDFSKVPDTSDDF